VNTKPDPRITFNPEHSVFEALPAVRSWLPLEVPHDVRVPEKFWLTRGARGISWHRTGRVSRGPVQ
jgi:hypothetical protein